MFFPLFSWDTSFIDDVVANPFRLGAPSSERENIERGWEAEVGLGNIGLLIFGSVTSKMK